jgi:hypothetical protein
VNDSREALRVDRDRGDEIEAQQGEVRKIVLREQFAVEVRVHEADTPKTRDARARSLDVRDLDRRRVADDDLVYVAAPIDENSDLPTDLVRDLGELARELLRNDAVRRDSAIVEFFETAYLVRLEALRFSFDCVCHGTPLREVYPPGRSRGERREDARGEDARGSRGIASLPRFGYHSAAFEGFPDKSKNREFFHARLPGVQSRVRSGSDGVH